MCMEGGRIVKRWGGGGGGGGEIEGCYFLVFYAQSACTLTSSRHERERERESSGGKTNDFVVRVEAGVERGRERSPLEPLNVFFFCVPCNISWVRHFLARFVRM